VLIKVILTNELHEPVLLEKLTVAQAVIKFPTFHGTQKFITIYTRAPHKSIS
jgi:hypothetical protein